MQSNAAAMTVSSPVTGSPNSLYQKRKRPWDTMMKTFIYLSTLLTVAILVGILAYILINGIGYLSWQFISTPYSQRAASPDKGILPMIINTIYVVVITLLIAVPIGLCSAIYLTQYAKQGKMVSAIRFTTDTLAGIPSVLFALFGMSVFVSGFGFGYSILSGCLTMAICILPTIIRTTEEALLTVPASYKEGALALGAGKLRVILGIVLPCAVPGILTAVILAMGRIVGESAIFLFTTGTGYDMPTGFFDHVMAAGRTLTVHLYTMAKDGTANNALQIAFATSTVLLILVFLLNRLASLLSKVLKKG